ncbi:MAG TPA: hypothetical protein VG936_05885 [Lacunisphaera sp.]|nr:hypothetical protein [Lacunisphaera sp.]
MKRPVCLALVLGLFLSCALPVPAAEKKAAAAPAKTPGVELAVMASQVTGIAISPLLGVSCIGAWQWWGAHTPEQKAALPWFAQLQFWLPALLLVALCAAKDSFGAMVPPGWKKPLDVAETFENKVSGLVAAGAVVPSLVALASKLVVHQAGLEAVPGMTSGLAMIQLGALDFSWLLTILMVPLSVAVFAVVWVVAHAINVLILLSPWGGVDAFLKASRTAVLSLVAATAYIDPVVGATLSLVIVVIAWFLAGWAFRLMVFGTVFSWDFFTLKHRRFELRADNNKLFTARPLSGAPLRTWGRLHQEADGRLLFKYRPWLVLAERTAEVPREGLVVGKGVFYSEVLGFEKAADRNVTLLLLPPRYRGHEELFARTYHISGTCDVGLRRAWSWLKEALGFGAKKAAPAAS